MAEQAQAVVAGRSHISLVNTTKVHAIYDFAFGDYLATETFFSELSRIQAGLINKGEVELSTGNVAKLDEAGGLLALQIHMEGLNAAKDAMQGLAKLGLKNENKLWTLQ